MKTLIALGIFSWVALGGLSLGCSSNESNGNQPTSGTSTGAAAGASGTGTGGAQTQGGSTATSGSTGMGGSAGMGGSTGMGGSSANGGAGGSGNPAGASGTAGAGAGGATGGVGATAGVGTGGTQAGRGGTSGEGSGSGGGPSNSRRPNPIISRGKTVFSSPANGSVVVDGTYHNGGWSAGRPTAGAPAWVAIRLGAGPTRVLVVWDDGGTYNYKDPTTATVYGLPSAYHIDVSNDSTNGNDGTWTPAVTVSSNPVRTRGHAVAFAGQSWVKMVITGTPANESTNGVQIAEIDVHDISATGTALPEDTWFFMGDSITAYSYDRAPARQPSFATLINTGSPAYFPAMINGGIGGERASDALSRLSEALTLNPDYRYFALSYGTNDAGNQVGTTTFQNNMQSMITMIKAAGRIPVIPRIPYSGDGGHGMVPQYNAVVDALVPSNNLMTGPDLYTHFMQNAATQFMADNLHPNDAGQRAINQLWATAMDPLYP